MSAQELCVKSFLFVNAVGGSLIAPTKYLSGPQGEVV